MDDDDACFVNFKEIADKLNNNVDRITLVKYLVKSGDL